MKQGSNDSLSPEGQASIGSILLVENSEVDRYLFERAAVKSELVDTVTFASSAAEALDVLRQPGRQPFDAILLHIRMPGIDGFEFLDRAMGEFPDGFTKAVLLTLTTDLCPQDTERAASYPLIKGSIRKPFTHHHFEDVARSISG